jgi:acetyltransferase-like isoleucine patch superfamily enzyme
VHIVEPQHVDLGNSVWIDRNVVLIAGPPRRTARIISRETEDRNAWGRLRIGDNSHLGVGTIIQAHGGVTIGDFFTSSAGTKIYSFSNEPKRCRKGTLDVGDAGPEYVLTPVEIGHNVWLGLDVVVIGHRIGTDSFVMPKSVVKTDIGGNTVSAGNPAQPIRERFGDQDL